jgi:hypothetical protein
MHLNTFGILALGVHIELTFGFYPFPNILPGKWCCDGLGVEGECLLLSVALVATGIMWNIKITLLSGVDMSRLTRVMKQEGNLTKYKEAACLKAVSAEKEILFDKKAWRVERGCEDQDLQPILTFTYS